MPSWKRRYKKAEYLLAVAKFDNRNEQDKSDRLLAYYAQRTQELEAAAQAVLVEAEAGLCRSTFNAVRLRLRPLITQEAVESDNTELAEAKADAAVVSDLREARDGWERGCWEAEQELAEAKVEIERLRRRQLTCDDCLRSDRNALAEAKAEIERLRKERDAWKRRCAELERLLAVQKASIADAALGRLVRKMREDTRLERTGSLYSTMSYCARTGWSVIVPTCATDPAEALRAIQETANK